MESERLETYKDWSISVHCETIKLGGRPTRYTALGILTLIPKATATPRVINHPPAVVHFAGKGFATSEEANAAVIREAKRQIDLALKSAAA